MQAIQPILLGLGMLLGDGGAIGPRGPDLAHLQEMLHDRQHALGPVSYTHLTLPTN